MNLPYLHLSSGDNIFTITFSSLMFHAHLHTTAVNRSWPAQTRTTTATLLQFKLPLPPFCFQLTLFLDDRAKSARKSNANKFVVTLSLHKLQNSPQNISKRCRSVKQKQPQVNVSTPQQDGKSCKLELAEGVNRGRTGV